MTKDEARTDDGTACPCLDDDWDGATDDSRRTYAYHTVGTYLSYFFYMSFAAFFITSTSYRRYDGIPFPISPDPLPPTPPMPACLNYSPAPRSGDAPTDIGSHGRVATQSSCFQSSCRSLTPFVRYRNDACLLTGRTTGRRTERETRTRNRTMDGTRGGTS